MASSSSSSTARGRRKVPLLRLRGREEHYEGEPRYCHHNLVAPRWTAWTLGNAGRRFYGCPNYYQDGGCKYFSWHDSELGERANHVINELLDEIETLYQENNMIGRGNDGQNFIEELHKINAEMKKLKRRHEREHDEPRNREMKFKVASMLLLITWLWLLFDFFFKKVSM